MENKKNPAHQKASAQTEKQRRFLSFKKGRVGKRKLLRGLLWLGPNDKPVGTYLQHPFSFSTKLDPVL